MTLAILLGRILESIRRGGLTQLGPASRAKSQGRCFIPTLPPTDPCQEALYTPNKGREVITLSSDASAQAETHVQGFALLPICPGVPALPTLMHHPQNPSWGWPVGSVADTLLAFSAWRGPTYGEKVLQPLDPRADGRVGPDPIPEEPWALHGEGKHTGF